MPDHKLLSLAAALRARVEEVLLRPSLCKTQTLGGRCAASLRPTKNWWPRGWVIMRPATT
jgi:hypothetical protein